MLLPVDSQHVIYQRTSASEALAFAFVDDNDMSLMLTTIILTLTPLLPPTPIYHLQVLCWEYWLGNSQSPIGAQRKVAIAKSEITQQLVSVIVTPFWGLSGRLAVESKMHSVHR